MTLTTIPTYIITFIIFIFLGLSVEINGNVNIANLLSDIEASFTISPWLFLVPVIVIGLIIKKTEPFIALLVGNIISRYFCGSFQPHIINQIAGVEQMTFESGYKGVMDAITSKVAIPTENKTLADLFTSGGMQKMLGNHLANYLCDVVLVNYGCNWSFIHNKSDSLLKWHHLFYCLFQQWEVVWP
jgi:NhaC family Na+:H+ antiporter